MAYVNLQNISKQLMSTTKCSVFNVVHEYFGHYYDVSTFVEDDHGSEKTVFSIGDFSIKKYKSIRNAKNTIMLEFLANELFGDMYDTDLIGITNNNNLVFRQKYVPNFFDEHDIDEFMHAILSQFAQKGFKRSDNISYKLQYYHLTHKKTKDFFSSGFYKSGNMYFIKDNYYVGDINKYNLTMDGDNVFIYDLNIFKICNGVLKNCYD